MKVLQVINSLNVGGAEKLIADSLPLYMKKGIEVELLLLNGNTSPFFDNLNKSGVKIISLTKGGSKSIYNPLLFFKIIPLIKDYDILHVHLFPTLYWVALAKLFSFSSVKLIYTEHSTSNRRRGNAFFRILDKLFYKPYNYLVSITEEVYINLHNHLKDDSRKHLIIKNGIRLDLFLNSKPASREEMNLKLNDFILCQVAAFRMEKDQATTIKSLRFLPDNVKLLFVGDGVTRGACEKLAKDLTLNHRISFLGIRDDVPSILAMSDVALLSSLYEGLSLSAIESMASGKPFISTDAPGLKGMVENKGLLFPIGDSKKLAEHVLELMSNKEYYNRIGSLCLAEALNYSIDKMVDEYVGLYIKMLNEK